MSGTGYASGPGQASYDWCLEVDGRCEISAHTDTTTKTEWWTVIFIGEIKTTTSTSTQTTIECQGDWAMTFTHYGGLGIREAVTTHETSDDSIEKQSCRYKGTGPLYTDECTTAFSGEWGVHKTVDGKVDDWEFCKGAWSVDNAPVVSLEGLLTTKGKVSPCWWAGSFTSSRVNVIG